MEPGPRRAAAPAAGGLGVHGRADRSAPRTTRGPSGCSAGPRWRSRWRWRACSGSAASAPGSWTGCAVRGGGRSSSRSSPSPWSAGWRPCRSRSCCGTGRSQFGLTHQALGRVRRRRGQGLAAVGRGHLDRAAGARRCAPVAGHAPGLPRPACSLAGLVMLGSFVYPLLVEPLFNRFEPLPDGPLRTQVLALADQEGVQVDDVLVADASRRTTTLNAYVSGFGCIRRVVLYDNLVDGRRASRPRGPLGRRPRAGTRAPRRRAHRLAARRCRRPCGVGSARAGARPGCCRPGDGRGRPVVPTLLGWPWWRCSSPAPVENGISRRIETRADVDSLRATRDPAAFIAVQKAAGAHGPWPTPRRRPGRSSGSAATRRRCSGSPWPGGCQLTRRGHARGRVPPSSVGPALLSRCRVRGPRRCRQCRGTGR